MFLHRVIVQDQAIAADSVLTFDMSPNPLSVLLLCLRPLNDTGTLANFNFYRSIAAAMNRVSIIQDGVSIQSFRGEDLVAMNLFRRGVLPIQGNADNVDNERRCVVVPMYFGRWPYSSKSCLPGRPKGQTVLEVDFDIADTGYDGLRFSCESIEMPDAKPTEFERILQVTQTFAAASAQDVDLPITGDRLRGVLLFGTTGFGGASPAPSWGRVGLAIDGREAGYQSTDFEVAMTIGQVWGRQGPAFPHGHTVNAAGAGIEETTATFDQGAGESGVAADGWNNYAWLELDPTGDDAHSLSTKDKSSVRLLALAETADAVRAYGVERVAA